MLAGIIKEKDNNYYINLEEKNNIKTISVIHSKKNNTRCLREEEAILLLETILSSNLTYKEKYNDYDVYLDETENKRYFKDGKEDFKMFFYNNGIDYIKYKNKDNKKKSTIKKFRININETVFLIVVSATLALMIPKYRYKFIDSIYNNEITYESAKELIMNSNHLSIEDKIYLSNEDFINDVIELSDNNRNYSLREKLNNIEIINFEEEERPHTLGYYNSLEPNIIYLRDDITSENYLNYRDTLSHEFVHLLQNESDYLYIHEASAELISYEYYNDDISSYIDEVLRLRVLMEIIGPKPILECNFYDNDSSFEKEIKKYLDENDSKRLLELFKSSSDDLYDGENETIINKEIDSLLSTMYYNKNKKDIKDDKMIKAIYNGDRSIKRYYFNQNKKEFDQEIKLNRRTYELEKETIDDVKNSDKVEYYTYSDSKRFEEKTYQSLTVKEISNYDEVSISYRPTNGITMSFDDDNNINYYINGENYNQNEAYENGYLEKIFILTKSKTVNSFKDIDLNNCSNLKITYKDGTIGQTTYNKTTKTWGPVIKFKIEYDIEPSIKNKFSNQFSNETSKNIEILDMIDEESKNEKSEVKLI